MSEVPGEVGDWIAQEDDIPEMHFPSSDEGAGQPAGVHSFKFVILYDYNGHPVLFIIIDLIYIVLYCLFDT